MFNSKVTRPLSELENRRLRNELSAFNVVDSYLKNLNTTSLSDLNTTDNIQRNEYAYRNECALPLISQSVVGECRNTPIFVDPGYLFVGTTPMRMHDPEGRLTKVCVVVLSKTNDVLVDECVSHNKVNYGEFGIYGLVSSCGNEDKHLDYEEVVEIYALNDLVSHSLYHVTFHPGVPFKGRLTLLNNLLDKMLEVELKHNTRAVGGECYSRKLVAVFNTGSTVIPYNLCCHSNTESIHHDAVADILNNHLKKKRGG